MSLFSCTLYPYNDAKYTPLKAIPTNFHVKNVEKSPFTKALNAGAFIEILIIEDAFSKKDNNITTRDATLCLSRYRFIDFFPPINF